MTAYTHRFTVGDFECFTVADGVNTRTPESLKHLYSSAPDDELDAALAAHDLDRNSVPNSYNCLAVKTGAHTVLIDTGLGAGSAPVFGNLLDGLNAAGITPGAVDTLILSHAHGDHINGVTDADGALCFPNARHCMWKGEWDYWTDSANLEEMGEGRAAAVRKNLLPLADHISLVNTDGAEIVPGICAIPLPGHAPGHMALLIESNGEQLIYSADTVLTALHLEHPDWSPGFDYDKPQAIASRGELARRAIPSGALIIAYHFQFPGLGHIHPNGDVWRWEPLAE